MKKILYMVFVALLAAVTGPVWGQSQHTLGNIPEGWTVKANGDTVPVVNGTATITDGAEVQLFPPNPALVKSVTLTDAPAPSCRRITLDTVQHHFVAQDCDTLTGTLAENVKISIANGATVTLDGVTINGTNNGSYKWAGITCEGNATLVLKDGTTDTVKGFYENYPGIHVPENRTLTIQGGASGTGKLIASSNGNGAGIGGGWMISCGNIRIEDGIIEATGGFDAAGIGSVFYASCGDITITGGTIEATGGDYAAGIGSGYKASCGDITITGGVTRVTATKGVDAPNSIGAGQNGTCGTVTFGTQQMYNGTTWTTNPTSGQTYGGLNFTIKTTSNTNDTWELTCRRVDLSQITADSVMQDGDVLTGTLTANVKISIAAGATVTLKDVNINGSGTWTIGNYAGITCAGDATITLEGTNTVKGFANGYPGISVSSGKTLVINGTGELNASSNGSYDTGSGGAGIGGGDNMNCGNIEIQSGTVTATGNQYGAGIGGGQNANCGNITISGGTVTATGGYRAAGIGGGRRGVSGNPGQYDSGSCGNITISGGTINATGGQNAAGIGGGRGNNVNYKSSCGTITITTDVTKVTATKGSGADNSIGAGSVGICGTVTIGGVEGAITDSPYTYPPQP